jgi:hypothetical protein
LWTGRNRPTAAVDPGYILHHSAVGVSEGVRWTDPEETPVLLLGPTRDWTGASLWAAF